MKNQVSMKCKSLIVFSFLAVGLSGLSYGQGSSQERGSREVSPDGDSHVHPKTNDDSSAYHRQGKSFMATAAVLGAHVTPIPATGLGLSYFLTPDQLIYSHYSRGSLDLFVAKIESRVGVLGLQSFWGNSFYTKVGLGKRSLDFYHTDLFAEGTQKYAYADSYVGELVVGNQWQWENFTLGCDWFGVLSSIGGSKSEIRDIEGLSDLDQERLRKDYDSLGTMTSIQTLRLHLGVSF